MGPISFSPTLLTNTDPLPSIKGSYVIEMHKLVGLLFRNLQAIAEKDRAFIETTKKNYTQASQEAAALQIKSGTATCTLATLSFAIFVAKCFIPNQELKEIVGIASQQTPQVGAMWTSTINSKMGEKNSESNLELEKYRAKSAKGPEQNSQDLTNLLHKAGEMLEDASRVKG